MLDLDTIATPAPAISLFSPKGPGAFAGSQTDVNDPHAFPGGPNGVITVDSGQELWLGDSNTYTGNPVNGVPSNLPDYSNDNCDSSVNVITLATGNVTVIPTNSCFRSDELADDPDHHVVLISNPSEKPNGSGYVGSTGISYSVNIPASSRKFGVPTGPFISLIDTDTKKVLKQIPFDGTHGTPNATNGIEQSVYSPATKLFYVAVPSDGLDGSGNPDPNGAIAIVNPTTFSASKFPLNNCNPSGMTLGPDGKEVFLACNSSSGPQVVSLLDGSLISAANQFAAASPAPTDAASFGIWNTLSAFGAQYACDEAWYNSALNKYMTTCNFPYDNADLSLVDAGTGLTLPSGASGGTPTLQVLDTNANALNSLGVAHSVASDPVTGAVIVPLPAGDPLCSSMGASGCLDIWASKGSGLQLAASS